MKDLIERQAAIEAVSHGCQEWRGIFGRCEENILALPSAQPEQRWVPCSERVPNKRGYYLTTTKDEAVYCDYWNEDNFDRTEMVIAWMPLPEPYKGVGA